MRWIAVTVWALAALSATALLGIVGAKAGPWPESVHLLGHLVLCGGIAAGTTWALPGTRTRRAVAGVGTGLLLGIAIELVQARFHPVWTEASFDLGMDLLGAVAGVLAASRVAEGPGHVASAILHPLLVVPVGLALAVGWPWAGLTVLAGVPAVALWLAGVAGGSFTDADVSHRPQRAPLMVAGVMCAIAFFALGKWGPEEIQSLSLVLLLGGAAGALLTAGGLKVSGHVAIPAALGLWALPHEPRAAQWFLGAALLLSWARWTAGRHRPVEVAAAWGLGLATLLAA